MNVSQPTTPPQEWVAPVALVYRKKTGCRQYCFDTVEALADWASRHPYRNEDLRVQVIHGRRFVSDYTVAAPQAADHVREVLATAAALVST